MNAIAIAWFQTKKDQVQVCKLWDKQLLILRVWKSTDRFTKSPSLVLASQASFDWDTTI